MKLKAILAALFLIISHNHAHGKILILASNPAIASLVKSISGNLVDIRPLSIGLLHHHRITPQLSQDIKVAKILFYASKNVESYVQTIRNNECIVVEITKDPVWITIQDNAKDVCRDNHIWLLPNTSSIAIEVIYSHLVALMPEHKAYMYNNLIRTKSKLYKLQEIVNRKLQNCPIGFFTNHNSLCNLISKYSLLHHGVLLQSGHIDGIKPSIVMKIKELGSQNAKVCLFTDTEHMHGINNLNISKFKNITVHQVDADGMSVDYDNGIDGYESFITMNIDKIARCICTK